MAVMGVSINGQTQGTKETMNFATLYHSVEDKELWGSQFLSESQYHCSQSCVILGSPLAHSDLLILNHKVRIVLSPQRTVKDVTKFFPMFRGAHSN